MVSTGELREEHWIVGCFLGLKLRVVNEGNE